MRRKPTVLMCIALCIFSAESCKDMGDTIVLPASGVFTMSQHALTLVPGGRGGTKLSGGTQPYSFVTRGDTSVAVPSLIGDSLKIVAVNAGTSTVVVGDNGSPRLTDTLRVTVSVQTLISFSGQIQPLFTTNCVDAGCHPGGGSPFSLQAGASYSNLVGRDATTGPCLPIKRVQASNANASALVKRLEGTCGSRMPLNGSALSASQIQLIRDWIEQGALNN